MKSCLKLTNAKLLAEIWDLIQKHGQVKKLKFSFLVLVKLFNFLSLK